MTLQPHEWASLLQTLQPMNRAKQGLEALRLLAKQLAIKDAPSSSSSSRSLPRQLMDAAPAASMATALFGATDLAIPDDDWLILGAPSVIIDSPAPATQLPAKFFDWIRTPVPVSVEEVETCEVIDPLSVDAAAFFDVYLQPPAPDLMVPAYCTFTMQEMRAAAGPLIVDAIGGHFLIATGIGRALPPQARRLCAARIGAMLISEYDGNPPGWQHLPVDTVAKAAGISFVGGAPMKAGSSPEGQSRASIKVFDADGLVRDGYGVAYVCNRPNCVEHQKSMASRSPLLLCPARHHGHPDLAKIFRMSALNYLRSHYPRVHCAQTPVWKQWGAKVGPSTPWGTGASSPWFVPDVDTTSNRDKAPRAATLGPRLYSPPASIDCSYSEQL